MVSFMVLRKTIYYRSSQLLPQYSSSYGCSSSSLSYYDSTRLERVDSIPCCSRVTCNVHYLLLYSSQCYLQYHLFEQRSNSFKTFDSMANIFCPPSLRRLELMAQTPSKINSFAGVGRQLCLSMQEPLQAPASQALQSFTTLLTLHDIQSRKHINT